MNDNKTIIILIYEAQLQIAKRKLKVCKDSYSVNRILHTEMLETEIEFIQNLLETLN